MKIIIVLALLFFLLSHVSAQDNIFPYKADSKKAIIYQGDTHLDWSADIKDNLEEMQKNRPYINGLTFHVGPKYIQPSLAFNNEIWSEKSLRFNDLKIISKKWTIFSENFILIWGNSCNKGFDFFNDTLWVRIIKNTELLGKAVKIAGCKGILFDPEFYNPKETYSAWWYSKKNDKYFPTYVENGKSFKDAQLKARQRGKEYVKALQIYMPKITIFTCFLYGCVWDYCYGDINKLPDSQYALLASFTDGMFEALNPESMIIDGNEASYYIDETRKYLEDSDHSNYGFVRFEAPSKLCDSAAIRRWNAQGQVAMALYVENCYNLYGGYPWRKPDYQSKWMMHNVYNGMLTTDQYLWIFINSDFWKGNDTPKEVDLFKDLSTALAKFRKGDALGYNMFKKDSDFKFQSDKQPEFVFTPKITLMPSSEIIPGSITFTAKVEPDAAISKVEFYVNSIKVNEATLAPYKFTKEFGKSGYLIFARVFLKDGKHTTSAPIVLHQ